MISKRRLLGRNDDNSGYLLSPLVNNFDARMKGEIGRGMRLRPIQTDEKGKRDHVLYHIPIHYIKGHPFWIGQGGCG